MTSIQSQKPVRGFTTLFAVLVASLLLAVGVAIFDITYKELVFSTITRDSDLAFYAADTGLECALLWDLKYDGGYNFRSGSVFATSADSIAVPSNDVLCGGVDIAALPWTITSDSGAATTTFTLPLPSGSSCVSVTVAKWGRPMRTVVVSRGYNMCGAGTENRIERALQANY